MKELSIEQKAKRYDEAIEKARKLATDLPNGRNDRLYHVDDLEHIFPELKESEDERIRKELIENLKELSKMYDTLQTAKEYRKVQSWIAWLEKQQKPEVDQHSLPVSDNSSLPTFNEDMYHPCTEKSYDWSEEDEERIKNILSVLDVQMCWNGATGKQGNPYQNEINWLKSLKDRHTWKPSDEQLDALQYVYRNINPPLSDKLCWNSLKTMELMYQDLKKLKG